jgi:hypothetical protein
MVDKEPTRNARIWVTGTTKTTTRRRTTTRRTTAAAAIDTCRLPPTDAGNETKSEEYWH